MLVAEELGLQIIEELKAGIKYEIKHNFVNITGKSGDFASFVKQKTKLALRHFKHSEAWQRILKLITRYPFVDLSTRIQSINSISKTILHLEDIYQRALAGGSAEASSERNYTEAKGTSVIKNSAHDTNSVNLNVGDKNFRGQPDNNSKKSAESDSNRHVVQEVFDSQAASSSDVSAPGKNGSSKQSSEYRTGDVNSHQNSMLAAPAKVNFNLENNKKPKTANFDIYKDDVKYVRNVGPALAAKLNKLDIFTVFDLMSYAPRDYISYDSKSLIAELVIDEHVTVFGEILKITSFKPKRKSMLIMNIEIKDISGVLKITKFFQGNAGNYYLKQFKSMYPDGSKVICFGKVGLDTFSKKKTLLNPVIEVVSDELTELSQPNSKKLIPVYSLTEGLSMSSLKKAILTALDTYKNQIEDFMPAKVINDQQLYDLPVAYQALHDPADILAAKQANYRLCFDQFFMMQLQFLEQRFLLKQQTSKVSYQLKEDSLVYKFLKCLAFDLTGAQKRVFFDEIVLDMLDTSPMHRLLQGDVGSGKTIVAFLTMLLAADNGFQSAVMVPTEVLAKQHYRKFQEYIQLMSVGLNLKAVLLVGKQGAAQRRQVLGEIASGEANFIVGTHALIQDKVEYYKLGLAVIDEQHRFGVKQRDKLTKKAKDSLAENDHVINKLFMTATPIPRTLALATHGDLDMSEIDELPSMRVPIKTSIVKRKLDAHKLILKEIKAGHQAYIVFPLIDESEALAAKAASAEFAKLKAGVFKDLKLGLMHGKLKEDEKEAIMNEFRAGTLDILISTTVIEVGVDVPNATVILIESSERFGLAQLHQLRGRVGRSDLQSYCLLASDKPNPANNPRLQIMASTNNGFIIAQHDLRLRGAGDFMGLRQSGLNDQVLHDLVDQEEVLYTARNVAKNLLEEDLELKNYPLLKEKLAKIRQRQNFDAG
jgi:ATP-dependent DNA helicase RecG